MIQKVLSNGKVPVKIWTNDIEQQALEQLEQLSNLPFLFKHVAVMPDVHAGKGSTVGTVIATRDVVIPSAVGVDIGCGMAAVLTPYTLEQLDGKFQSLRSRIEREVPTGFSSHKDGSHANVPQFNSLWNDFENGAVPSELKGLLGKAMMQLGTLGGGNHFIEISVDKENRVWIVLHSGSRNIGKQIADVYIKSAKSAMERWHISLPHKDLAYLSCDDAEGVAYIRAMDWAQQYAQSNRDVMLRLAARALSWEIEKRERFDSETTINCHHNYMSREHHFGQNVFVTRKGAIRARVGEFGIIPGSMGERSYIVVGKGESNSFESASHGAGRKFSRTEARRRFTIKDAIEQTAGVECKKDESVLDELPSAYKNIDDVINYQSDLVTPIQILKQVISVKG